MTSLPETRMLELAPRALAYCEYGDPSGIPLIQLHGSPGARYQRYFDEEAYARAGFRTIAFDRPGFGRSTRVEGRTLVDGARDIERVADALAFERFAICGWSSGAASAFAAASLLGTRVLACAALMPRAPRNADIDFKLGMDERSRRAADAGDEGPEALWRCYADGADEFLAGVARGNLPMKGPPRGVAIAQQFLPEAWAQGPAGIYDETIAVRGPWTFDLGAIRCPMKIWAGTKDSSAPPQHARWLATKIPGAELEMLEGEHTSFLVHFEDILAWLKRSSTS